MTWVDRRSGIKVGDVVTFNKHYYADPHVANVALKDARGIVEEISDLVTAMDMLMVQVRWENADLPSRVNMAYLELVPREAATGLAAR